MTAYTIQHHTFDILTAQEKRSAKNELLEVINGFGRSRLISLNELYDFGIQIHLEADVKKSAQKILDKYFV